MDNREDRYELRSWLQLGMVNGERDEGDDKRKKLTMNCSHIAGWTLM